MWNLFKKRKKELNEEEKEIVKSISDKMMSSYNKWCETYSDEPLTAALESMKEVKELLDESMLNIQDDSKNEIEVVAEKSKLQKADFEGVKDILNRPITDKDASNKQVLEVVLEGKSENVLDEYNETIIDSSAKDFGSRVLVITNFENKGKPLTNDGSLNPEQEYAVKYAGKHLLVIAGAGTGKTKTIIERAKYLIRKGVAPNRILILSFTRKSAREIVERIKMQTDSAQMKGLQGQTFHSWCMSIIKSRPDIFMQSSATVLDEDDRTSCIKIAYGKTITVKNGKNIKPSKVIDVYSYVMNTRCNLSEAIRKVVLDNAPLDEECVKIYIESNKKTFADIIKFYIDFKQRHNYIDYDDILHIVAKSLKENKQIRDDICSHYEHILIDEMQDTNPLQYELLSSFYSYCNLFCVGDDAQSIYGFRGADFNSIHHFTEVVPNAERCKLTLNYRSTQEILDLSNWLLKESPIVYGKELVAVRGRGIKPILINWQDPYQEANDITEKIIKSVAIDGENNRDNLVLSRTVSGLRIVESSLIEKKVPYVIFGGAGLMQSAHIRDVISILRLVANFLDEIAWMRYLQLWRGIGEITATQITSDVLKAYDFSSCIELLQRNILERRLNPEIYEALEAVYGKRALPSKAMEEAIGKMSPYLKEKYIDSWDWREADFPILCDIANKMSSITEFISEYVLEPHLQTTLKVKGVNEDKCILSTIHSAKGLEAKNCYIVNVSTSAYPTVRAMQNGEEAIEEERRCLYVALTRAKDKLYIYRNGISQNVQYEPLFKIEHTKGYFLQELPPTLVERKFLRRGILDCGIPDSFNGQPVKVDNDFDFS